MNIELTERESLILAAILEEINYKEAFKMAMKTDKYGWTPEQLKFLDTLERKDIEWAIDKFCNQVIESGRHDGN